MASSAGAMRSALRSGKRKTAVLRAALIVGGGPAFAAWYRASAGGHAAHADAEYFCHMHPTIVRDKPGECPICGMKLETRSAPGAAATPPGPSTHGNRR